MLDKYNRDINYLRVSITDRCNLRCVYCMPKDGVSLIGHDDILRYEEILRIIRLTVDMGVKKVRLTGGEPLVRRGVVEFISSIKMIDGLSDVSLTTNGILLEAYAEKLFAAGLKRINVSIDSLNHQKYAQLTRGGDLSAVIRGIDQVSRIGFSPIKINIVVIKGFNEDEILDFARLTIDKPYQIRFIEIMTIGRSCLDYDGKYMSSDLIKDCISKTYRLVQVDDNANQSDGPAQMYRIEGGAGEIGFISPLSHQFCLTCNRLRLTSDGQIRACLLSDEEFDLKRPLRDGCSDEHLKEIIKKAIARKSLKYEPVCSEERIKKCVKGMSSIGG